MQKKPLIGYYNPSVLLTYFSLAFSVFGIVTALNGDLRTALICLLISGTCDMIDGSVARLIKRDKNAKHFGIEIDSLCDLICFGIFPSIIVYSVGATNYISVIIMICYILAQIIRLGYYNVDEVNRQNEETDKRKSYRGLPVTAISMILPALFLLNIIFKIPYKVLGLIILALYSPAMILNFPIRKLKLKGMLIAAIFGLSVAISLLIFGNEMKI